MEWIVEAGKFISENWPILLAAINGILAGIIAIAMMIPGDEPEKTLQAIVDFIGKLSKKKSE